MSAQRAQVGHRADVGEFRCPLSDDEGGRCHLFEPAVRPVQATDLEAQVLQITCRFLALESTEPSGEGGRCLLGNAKTRRDHLA